MKKKLFCFALAVVFALFCGCSSADGNLSADDVSESLANPFSARLNVVCGGNEYSAALTRDADSIDVTLDSPALFKGMVISFADGGDTAVIDYKGISFSMNATDIPYASAVSAVVGALNSATAAESLTALTEDGETVISGDGFELRFSSSDSTSEALPFSEITLNIPEQNIAAHITDFKPAI